MPPVLRLIDQALLLACAVAVNVVSHLRTPELRYARPVVSSTELLDTDGSVLLDDEHAATLRNRLDHVARQTENGGFVGRGVAGDERATPLGKRIEDATQPGGEGCGVFLDELG